MASSAFFGLAHTLRRGAHVRVGLVISRLPPAYRLRFEAMVVAISAATVGYLFYHALQLTWESAEVGEVSVGLLRIPTWIPQTFMCIGLGAMLLALVDSLASLLSGVQPVYPLDQDEP